MSSSTGTPSAAPKIIRSIASAAVIGVGLVSLTGCVGLLPNSNTKAGEKLIHGGHKVVYSVQAPHGSKITYSQGSQQFTDQTSNFNRWTEEDNVEGIQRLELTVSVEDGANATCTITVDGVTVSTANSMPGVNDGAHCTGTTTKN